MAILAVDLGNYNINTSEGVMFPATFTVGEVENPIGEEIVTIGEENYCMAKECAFDYEFNKNKKNYKPNLFYAIHKSIEETEIDLVLGIPVENFGVATDFKADLEGKEFEFKVNGEDKKVKINRVAVVGEGISSYYMLSKEQRQDKDIMIIDIGGRTINVVTFRNGRLEYKKQINMGMINHYEDVKTRHNSSKGDNLETEQMYSYINKGMVEVDHQDEVNFVNKMFNAITPIANKDFYDVYYTGGGSLTLEKTLKEIYSKGTLMENPLYTNVNGNKRIAVAQWRK